MNLNDLKLLFEFNYWANQKIITATRDVSAEQLTQPMEFPNVNLLKTLEHILDAEYVWRMICMNNRFMGQITDSQSFPNVDSIAMRWEQEEADMKKYLDSLSDDDLDNI